MTRFVVPCLFIAPVAAAADSVDWPTVIEGLLARDAPPRDWRPFAPYRDRAPPEDAPLEVLATYWSGGSVEGSQDDAKPPAAVSERLIDWVRDHPEDLDGLLHHLPRTAAARERVEEIVRRSESVLSTAERESIRSQLQDLREPSQDELIERASIADEEADEIAAEPALRRLLERDRKRAREILEGHRRAGPERLAALSLRLLHEDSVAHDLPSVDDERKALQAIASDPAQPALARAHAIAALTGKPWPGQEAWFLALFADASLESLSEDHRLWTPLAQAVLEDPARWIPLVARLVGNEERTVHDNAVTCLAELHLERARADALRPLLPWLEDPGWATASDTLRLRVIQSLDALPLPESVPGLMSVVRNERFHAREAAARALAVYKDPRAVPALEQALADEEDERRRSSLLEALLACGGLDLEGKAKLVESYARRTSTPEGRQARPACVALIRQGTGADDDLAGRLIARAEALAGEEPGTARELRRLVSFWPLATSAGRAAADLAAGDVDAVWVATALEARESLRSRVAGELRALVERGGPRAAVAAILLGDEAAKRTVLGRPDAMERAALLACARRVGDRLPVGEVGAWLQAGEPLLARAARAYLLTSDTPESRDLLARGNLAEILGSRGSHDPGHFSFEELGEWGERLVREMQGNEAPDEVLALLSAGYWGNAGQRIIIARQGRAEIVLRLDNGRYRQRALAETEWTSLQRFIEATRFFDLPPLTTAVHDGIQYEALRLRRDGARRVFMNNPGMDGSIASPYHLLVRRIHRLASFSSPLRYDVLDAVPGGSLLLESGGAIAVASVTSRLLVQVIDEEESRTWRELAGGKLGGPSSAPAGWLDGPLAELNRTEIRDHHLNDSPWQARLGDGLLLAGTPRQLGWSPALRWFRPDVEPVVVVRDTFAHPIVSPDGRWALVARSGRGGWAEPNDVVRISLPDGKVLAIDIPAADTLEPVAWVPPHGKVLVRRANREDDDSRWAGEHFLVDPATGSVTPAAGDLRPWSHFTDHPPQPTGKDGELWAAIPDEGGTTVGRYDARAFTFSAIRRYPGLRFDSASVWVDEPGKSILVVDEGSVLRLPLE